MEIQETKIATRLSIRHPKNILVSKKSPVEDFDIYTLESEGVIILSFYVGNHPNYDGTVKGQWKIKGENKLNTECRDFKHKKKKYANECIADLREFLDFPQYVHFWYDVDTQKQKQIADDIIRSLESAVR